MNAKFKACVIQKFDIRTGKKSDGNTWTTQEILVETVDEQYPKKVLLMFINKKTDALVEGRAYEFEYEAEAREYNGKWYNSIKCWKFKAVDKQPELAPQTKEEAEKSDMPF